MSTSKRKRYTPAQRAKALDRARDEDGVPRCAICGEPIDELKPWVLAHGVGEGDSRSLWAGGSNDDDHVGPAHPECNQQQEAEERPGREKADRVRAFHLTGRSKRSKGRPMPGSRASDRRCRIGSG